MSTIPAFIRRHELAAYFALAFAISWSGVLWVVGGPAGIPGAPEAFDAQLPAVLLALLAGPAAAGLLMAALTGQWHHVVAVKNGDEYRIYFNGNLDEMDSGNASCTNLHIAQDMGDVFVGMDFTGRIDDIIIYNRALSQQEVAELFALGGCCE